MSAVVLDSSTALQLLLPDSEADRSRFLVLMASIEDGSRLAHVPMIFMNEVAAGCARAVRGGRATKAEAEAFFHLLSAVKLNLDMEILPPDAWYARAMQMHCQVADGAYLALARRLGAELACDAIRRRRRLRTSPFGTTPGQSARGPGDGVV